MTGVQTCALPIFSDWGLSFVYADTIEEAIIRLGAAQDAAQPFSMIMVFRQYLDTDPIQLLHQLTLHGRHPEMDYILVDDEVPVPGWLQQVRNGGYAAILGSTPSRSILFRTLHKLTAAHYYYESGAQPGVAEAPASYQVALQGLKILVGEDNPINQMLIRKVLEHGNHQVTIETNGEQVLNALERETFDLLILDMHMPVINGIEVIKSFRCKHPEQQDFPIMMLTANATREAMRACRQAGVDIYLTKPVEPQKLLDTIRRLAGSKTGDTRAADTSRMAASIDPPQAVPLLDGKTLNAISRMARDKEFVSVLVNSYLANTDKLIVQINSALAARSFDAIRSDAHLLHGSSSSIGAARLAAAADKLSGCIRAGNHALAAPAAQEMIRACVDTKIALQNYLQEYKTNR